MYRQKYWIFTTVSFACIRVRVYKMNAPEYKESTSVFSKEIFLSENKKANVTTLAILFATLIVTGAAITATVYVGSSKPTELHKYAMDLLFLYLDLPGLAMGLFLSANYIFNKPLRKAVGNEIKNIFARFKEHVLHLKNILITQ